MGSARFFRLTFIICLLCLVVISAALSSWVNLIFFLSYATLMLFLEQRLIKAERELDAIRKGRSPKNNT